jgi:ABC transporter with metal-binding/Fe-S-binding domain ATP-binding protein
MICAILFSGGKDSCYAAYIAKKKGYDIACLISIHSENKESYMFHTPSIKGTKKQAEVMDIPLIIKKTKGKKEEELKDLESAIKKAKAKYKINSLVTGAICSTYQASRIQKICDKLDLKCFNLLWHKNEANYIKELIKNKFKVVIVGVFAYPLDKSWLLKEINESSLKEFINLNQKYKIHIAGEGGEIETFVLDCPLFKKSLKITDSKISGEKNSWRADIEVI